MRASEGASERNRTSPRLCSPASRSGHGALQDAGEAHVLAAAFTCPGCMQGLPTPEALKAHHASCAAASADAKGGGPEVRGPEAGPPPRRRGSLFNSAAFTSATQVAR